MSSDSSEGLALVASGLGRRYRHGWALRDCNLALPAGRIAAVVGPNGAGKSTLMRVVAGILPPTTGDVRVFGERVGDRGTHARLAFLAQDKPLYRSFTVVEILHAGRALNPRWDQTYAERLVREADVPFNARLSSLSGGQRTRVALAVALGRRPDLVMLDEPLADLDPLARQEFMQGLLAETVEHGLTVLLSSHVISELEGVCDFLLLLTRGRVQLAGDIDDLVSEHQLLIGPAEQLPFPPAAVVERRTTGRQASVLLRAPWSVGVEGWQRHAPTLEELTLAYLRTSRQRNAFMTGDPA